VFIAPTKPTQSSGQLSPPFNSPIGSPVHASVSPLPEKLSFPRKQIKIVLFEGIHQVAVRKLENEDFTLELLPNALKGEALKQKIADATVVGIRSKTKITKEIIDAAPNLLCVGCFCIGTDQVDLVNTQKRGIPVFNSPFCNSRSVAELIIGQIINLSRKIGDKNNEMHSGKWNKSSAKCNEIRGKTIGIVGYGHIGSQLSVLAEAMGMRVIFYDVITVMPLGNSMAMPSLDELLRRADFVTLHVPDTPQTKNMIGAKEINLMQKGSYLLNASRGTVVVIPELVKALKSGHLGGAYLDVYPVEPNKSASTWQSELQGCPNTILSPHIGGSTLEAQQAIGEEVATRVTSFILTGSTTGAVNFPQVDVPYGPNTHRLLNIHRNYPGVLKEINNILSVYNVESQVLRTSEDIGYLIADVNAEASDTIRKQIESLPSSIKTRLLY